MSSEHHKQPQKRYLRTRANKQSSTAQQQRADTALNSISLIRSKILPRLSSWFQPHRRYNPKESFFPFPKVTFLVDEPMKLECQICRQVSCQIKSDAEPLDESTFSLLPCGHAACLHCLDKWFKTQDTCPFCRVDLVYPGCGHKVLVRPLTREGLHLLPRTLPDQGHIPSLCAQCLKRTLLTKAQERFRQTTQEFQAARLRLHRTQAVDDEVIMLAKREELETVLRDEVYFKQLSTWLTSW